MTARPPLVAVIDDDESARESLPDLVRELGYRALPFASGREFLLFDGIHDTGCLILDVAMPGMSGPELQQELTQRGHQIPIIFITALSDRNLVSDLLRLGATATLLKPFNEQQLRTALAAALLPS